MIPGNDESAERWNELNHRIDALESPGHDLKDLGQQLLLFLELGDNWKSRLADRARRDPKIATALQEALIMRESELADLVGRDRIVEAWCASLGDGPGDVKDSWHDWSAQVVLGLVPRLGSLTTEEGSDLVLRLLDAAPNQWVIANIGSGPLEDLLSADPENVADLIEREAPERPRLRNALAHTWPLSTPDATFARVKRWAEGEPD
jgi:hypothetical protein